MLFRKSAVPLRLAVLPQPALPSTDMLRRAALAQSWRRDRWVGTRREFWRWLVWALPRYVLPVFALVLLVLSLVYPFWRSDLPGEPLEVPVFFRLDKQLNLAPRSAAPLPEPAKANLIPSPSPTLRLDNRLHSQEP